MQPASTERASHPAAPTLHAGADTLRRPAALPQTGHSTSTATDACASGSMASLPSMTGIRRIRRTPRRQHRRRHHSQPEPAHDYTRIRAHSRHGWRYQPPVAEGWRSQPESDSARAHDTRLANRDQRLEPRRTSRCDALQAAMARSGGLQQHLERGRHWRLGCESHHDHELRRLRAGSPPRPFPRGIPAASFSQMESSYPAVAAPRSRRPTPTGRPETWRATRLRRRHRAARPEVLWPQQDRSDRCSRTRAPRHRRWPPRPGTT